MGLSVKAGSFASNTVTGNQSISGVGFQPKVVFFMSADRTSAGASSTMEPIFGVAVSDSQQWSIAAISLDNANTMDTYRHAHNDRCLHHGDGATTNMQLDFVSMDSDGFTVNVSDAPAAALVVCYLAIGGTDIQVQAGTDTIATSGATQATTGVGFQPDLVILGHIGRIAWPQTNAANHIFGLGAFTSSGQAAWATADQDNVGTSVTNVYQRSDSCIVESFTNTEQTRCTFASMDSDGFTLNVPVLPPTAALTFGYVAIRGARWKVGVETKRNGTGTKATTGVGFQPTGLFLFGGMNPASAAVTQSCNQTIGWSDGTNQFLTSGGSNDGAGTSNTSRKLSTTKIVGRTDGSEATTSEADLDSFDSDGFTLDWTTSDATTHEFIYLAMAANAVVSTFVPKVLSF